MSLNPRPARYAEARVARLNRKSEPNRLPPLSSQRVAPRWRGVGPAARAISRSSIIPLSGSLFSLASDRISSERSRQRCESFRKWWAKFTRLPDRCFKRASKYHGTGTDRDSYLSGFHNFYLLRKLALHFCFESALKRLLPNEARFARHVAHSLSHPVAWCSGRRRAAPASIRLGCVRPGRKSDRRSAGHREVHRQGNEKGGPEAQDAGR
jgi:hypothetical protein